MSKVIISFLGTGLLGENRSYRKAQYMFDGDSSIYESSFMVEAIRQKESADKIIIIGTKQSMWEELYRVYGEGDDDKYVNLGAKIECGEVSQSILDDLFSGTHVKCLLIDSGVNHDEIIANLEKVFKYIPQVITDGDEIILDITHSFRSIPVLMYSVLDFIKVSMKVDVRIYYGMLEYAASNNGIAPAVDLSSYYRLLDWSKAVDKFIKYGDGDGIAEMVKDQIPQLASKFNRVTDSFRVMQLTGVQGDLKKIDELVRANESILELKIFQQKIFEFVDRFKDVKTLSFFQLEVAKWYFENKFYALSYLVLVEAIISRCGELLKKNLDDYESREEVKAGLSGTKMNPMDQVIYDKFKKAYIRIRDERNVIAHAASFHNADHAQGVIKKVKNTLIDVESLFNS
ncbi:MAG: CRISPR-associated (Cas) DxTHG family protein [Parcubacteria group bacterium ADurb.Bin216]|nr:MAG: CRISPR-associated (Cas) DxTHG family protein [Parcubacteria group bacterium ADurb.Bin216]